MRSTGTEPLTGRANGAPIARARATCGWLLAAFTAHNAEELLTAGSWTPPGPLAGTDVYSRSSLATAMALLTVGIVLALLPICRRGAGRTPVALAALVAGALLTNAVGHVAHALLDVAYGPGLVTAVLLVAPTTALLLRTSHHTGAWSARALAGWALAGGLLSVPLIVLALLAAQPLTGKELS